MDTRRGKKLKRLITAGAVFAALAVSVLIAFGFKSRNLILINAISGEAVFCTQASDGETFTVSYTHSVNKSPVSERYQMRGSSIYLIELRYSAFGAGMPTEPEEGQSMRYEDGYMVIDGFEREMPYLCYFIGRAANHTLHFREFEIPLDTLDEPGQPVLFTAAVHPRVLVWLGIYP